MQKNTKNNRYKYDVGNTVYIIMNDKNIIQVTIEKRLKRPHRLSDNFYYCSWDFNGYQKYGIRYEKEMFPTYSEALNAFIEQNVVSL